MNIYIDQSDNLSIIDNYLQFNQIEHEKISLWDDTYKTTTLSNLNQSVNNLLIINFQTLNILLHNKTEIQNVINFCEINYLWVWNNADSLLQTLSNLDKITDLDSKIKPNKLSLFFDGEFIDFTKKIKNIIGLEFPYSFFVKSPRIKNSNLTKNTNANSFLLTTILKHDRPHRSILCNELKSRDHLLNQGHIICREFKDKAKWVGEQPHQHCWADGFPSMDLYRDSLLELVPETLYRQGFFITEKTIKPIATKTPFLIISTPGYLKYLKSKGFKTFDTLINEKYDDESNLPTRVKLVVELLDDIVKNGAYEFYKESTSILEHNQQRLFELSGGWDYNMDIFIKNQLDKLD